MFPLWWIAFPYVVFSISLGATPGVRQTGRWGDFSYGLYLYAFPVQQLVVWGWPALPIAVSALVTLLAPLMAAFVPWDLVEKEALRPKPRPRRLPAPAQN